MILLTGHTLTPKLVFTPESMNLSLVTNGISTATMTLGPEGPDVGIAAWFLDNTNPGRGIVWRVKGIDTDIHTQTRTIQLEHIVATLKDRLIFGEVTTEKISGRKSATTTEAVRYALRSHEMWELGTMAQYRSLPYNFNNTTVYDAITSACNTLEDWYWDFDLTSIPFKLHIYKKTSTVGCELRNLRNLASVRRSIDRTNLYTRFYPVGANNLHISGGYVSKNEGTYGVIGRTETDQSLTSEGMLRAWAEDRLRVHAEPTVTVTISGVDLSSATGESLDRIKLNMMCRVPLPEYNTTIIERVVKLQWPDKIREPERFTATLANQVQDVQSVIQRLKQSGSRNASGGALAAKKQQEEDHAWFVDTTDHVAMVAEALAGEGAAEDWSRVSSIVVDGEGIHQQVAHTIDGLVDATARIDVTENGITSLVKKTGVNKLGRNQTLYSQIQQTADKIAMIVTDTELDQFREQGGRGSIIAATLNSIQSYAGTVERVSEDMSELHAAGVFTNWGTVQTVAGHFQVSDDGSVLRVLDGTDFKITRNGADLKIVDSGNVVTQINASREGVQIKAKRVDLGNYATVRSLEATKLKVSNLMSGHATAKYLRCNDLMSNGSVIAAQSLTVMSGGKFYYDTDNVKWLSKTVVTDVSITLPSVSITAPRDFKYVYSGVELTANGSLVTGQTAGSKTITTSTIYYLGKE